MLTGNDSVQKVSSTLWRHGLQPLTISMMVRGRWWLLIALNQTIVQSLHNNYAETSCTTHTFLGLCVCRLVSQQANEHDRHVQVGTGRQGDASRSPGRLLPWAGLNQVWPLWSTPPVPQVP